MTSPYASDRISGRVFPVKSSFRPRISFQPRSFLFFPWFGRQDEKTLKKPHDAEPRQKPEAAQRSRPQEFDRGERP